MFFTSQKKMLRPTEKWALFCLRLVRRPLDSPIFREARRSLKASAGLGKSHPVAMLEWLIWKYRYMSWGCKPLVDDTC